MLGDCSLKGFEKSNRYECGTSKLCLSSVRLTEKSGGRASSMTRVGAETRGIIAAGAVTHLSPPSLGECFSLGRTLGKRNSKEPFEFRDLVTQL